jgi:hypothetical protein
MYLGLHFQVGKGKRFKAREEGLFGQLLSLDCHQLQVYPEQSEGLRLGFDNSNHLSAKDKGKICDSPGFKATRAIKIITVHPAIMSINHLFSF